jgi:hypothetical protein
MAINLDNVKSLDIEGYLYWNIGYVEDIQEEKKRKSIANEEAIKRWNDLLNRKNIKVTNETFDVNPNSQLDELKKDLYPFDEDTLMNVHYLETLLFYVNNCLEADIESFNLKTRFDNDSKKVAKKMLSDVIENRVFNYEGYIIQSLPLPRVEAKELLNVGMQFANVKYIQFLDSVINDLEINVKSSEKLSLPSKILLLSKLGFFNIDSMLKLPTGKRDKIVSLLLNADETNVRKNINALKVPSEKFNPKKKTTVKKLNEILLDLGIDDI